MGARLSALDGGPPLIGITTSEIRRLEQNPPIKESEPPGVELALGITYPTAVVREGGMPMIIPPLPAIGCGAVLERIDGLLLSGGPDIDPRLYGHEPHEKLGPVEQDLDPFELMLCRSALASRIPVLGICRGQQMINIAAGGTLHQHVPDVYGDAVEHRSPLKGVKAEHTVAIEPDTQVCHIVGVEELLVNSFHHQAIDELGEGLRVSATAPDGLIEAIEGTGEGYVVGVQWHVESLTATEPRHSSLVTSLVAAAREAAPARRAA